QTWRRPRSTLLHFTTLCRSLFLVTADAPGLQVTRYPTREGLHAADLRLSGVRLAAADCLGEPGKALPFIEGAVAAGAMATCADRSGEHTSELQSRENLVCRL